MFSGALLCWEVVRQLGSLRVAATADNEAMRLSFVSRCERMMSFGISRPGLGTIGAC